MSNLLERCLLAALALLGAGAVTIGWNYGDGTAHGGNLLPVLSGGILSILAVLSVFDRVTHNVLDGVAWRPWAFLGLTAVFLATMPVVGFPIVAPIWIIGLMALLGLRQPVVLILTGLGLPMIAWVLLDKLAHAPPPLGLLGGG